jgi:DNA-binding transcriptional MerR regulator
MGFTALQAARLTGCSPAQLDYWAAHGVVAPPAASSGSGASGSDRSGSDPSGTGDGLYSFRDLVALRMVRALLDAGVPLARTRRAVKELVAAGEELAGLRLVTDGTQVWACRDDGQILDALRHGQLALFVAVDRIAADVETDVSEFAAERQSFVAGLRAAGDQPAGTG